MADYVLEEFMDELVMAQAVDVSFLGFVWTYLHWFTCVSFSVLGVFSTPYSSRNALSQ
jgi:hypothetical protein